jgi:uncharacterized protein Veg
LTTAKICGRINSTKSEKAVTEVAGDVNTIQQIRLDLESCVGKRVKLRANRGRKKIVEAEGIIENTYPKIFVVKLDASHSLDRLSYTYADVLTKTVEVTVEEGVSGENSAANE